jgi:rubrerythrin
MNEAMDGPRLDQDQFREVVRHPKAHASILGQYRIGEYAGVVALDRLLGELEPDARLRRAMEIHRRDEARHTAVFTDWMRRLGVEPPVLPTDVEAYFSTNEEEHRKQRAMVDALPADIRRIVIFAGINAVERLAWNQFGIHLACLDSPEDRELLQSVITEEKFHLNYVEAELERQMKGEHGAIVTAALDESHKRFMRFDEVRRNETRSAIEQILGGGATS